MSSSLTCPCQSILSPSTSVGALSLESTSNNNGTTRGGSNSNSNKSTNNTVTGTIYCQSCIRRMLLPSIQKHNEALQKRNKTREWCKDKLLKHRSILDDSNHSNNEYSYQREGETTLIAHEHANTNTNTSTINSTPPPSLSSTIEFYRDELSTCNAKLKSLKEECTKKSILSANNTVHIQEQMKILDDDRIKVQRMTLCLHQLYQSTLIGMSSDDDRGKEEEDNDEEEEQDEHNNDGNLLDTINTHVKNVKYQRFQLALQIFNMHQMDVGEKYNTLTYDRLLSYSTTKPSDVKDDVNERNNNHTKTASRNITNTSILTSEQRLKREVYNKQPHDFGRICGFPLPHAGQDLFGVLPLDILTSSLRLVATMTNLLARCLGIVLPHPILLRPLLAVDLPDKSQQNQYRKSNNNNLDKSGSKSSWKPNTLLKSIKTTTSRTSHVSTADEVMHNDQIEMERIKQLMMQETGDITLSFNMHNDFLSTNVTSIKDLEQLDEEIARLNINDEPIPINNTTTINSRSSINNKAIEDSSSSSSSLMSLVGSSSNILSKHARRALDKMKGKSSEDNVHRITGATMYRPMDKASISNREKYASYAIICESNEIKINTRVKKQKEITTSSSSSNPLSISSLTQYELKPPPRTVVNREDADREKEKFTISLQLLQNDIMALCCQSGVPVATLWPAEAMLLNLYSLKLHCLHQMNS